MLDTKKLVKELSNTISRQHDLRARELEQACLVWKKLIADPELQQEALANINTLPTWDICLGKNYTLSANNLSEYDVIGIDGSQIYPDRHELLDCFLINIGRAQLMYRTTESSAVLTSEPIVRTENSLGYTPEYINALRSEQELVYGLAYMQEHKNSSQHTTLCLFDGTLIFWHLTTLAPIHDLLPRYCALLDSFAQDNLWCASYISLPNSREIIALIRAAFNVMYNSKNNTQNSLSDMFEHLVDTDVLECFLGVGERTHIFKNNFSVVKCYTQSTRPYFFYINTGHELARVELPAFVATDTESLNVVASMIYDQTIKGQGYPIALAEAHEQAVITNQDRELFVRLLSSVKLTHVSDIIPDILFDQNSELTSRVAHKSQKLMRKQRAQI